MTKTSIFGQSEVKQDEKKPIEFVKYLRKIDIELGDNCTEPSKYTNIVLLQKSYTGNLDLMYAYNENPNGGYLYLGHWNDGIVK